MWFLAILSVVLVSVKGEMRLCSTPVPLVCITPNPSPDRYIPGNAFELRAYCSSTKNYLECLNSYDLACKGRSSFSGLSSPLYYDRIKSFLDEACDESNSFNKALVRSLPCIKGRVSSKDSICSKFNNKVLKAYEDHLTRNPNTRIKDSFSRNIRDMCLMDIASAACLLESTEKECGFTAHEVASDAILRTQVLADNCYLDVFEELQEAVDDFRLDSNIKKNLKKYFVVELE